MFLKLDNIEADVSVYHKARKKFEKCKYKVEFFGQGVCKLYHYRFDNATDCYNYCASCDANTKSPTTTKKQARFPLQI